MHSYPRKITRDVLVKLLLDRWITNYEKLHLHSPSIQSMAPQMVKERHGSVTIKFDNYHEKDHPSAPSLFPTLFMLLPVPSGKLDTMQSYIHSFYSDGNPVYYFKAPDTKHCLFYTSKCDLL